MLQVNSRNFRIVNIDLLSIFKRIGMKYKLSVKYLYIVHKFAIYIPTVVNRIRREITYSSHLKCSSFQLIAFE